MGRALLFCRITDSHITDRRSGMLRIRTAIALGAIAVVAITSGTASANTRIVEKKKAPPVSLAKAAAWVAIGTALNLKPDQPAPEQFTDPAAPRVQQLSALVKGLSFKGVGAQTFARTAPDASDPSRLVGNYIVKVIVFGNAADAKKFRAADSKEVTDRGALKQVATYRDGVVLDDTQGHINVMYTIGNVAVDVRTGIAENGAGSGVTDAKHVADAVLANSKKA
jgi:hypothetical protein